MNWEKLFLIDRDRDSFKAFVGREIRERRRDERQLAEHCTTKHRLQARNSCVADARSYRVARRLPVPAAEHFDWKALIPVSGSIKPEVRGSRDFAILVYDDAGNGTQTHEHKGEFKEW
jgi:hypothetical protein